MLHSMRLVGTGERALELMTGRLRSREVRGRSLAGNDLWIDRVGGARIAVESMRALVRAMAGQPGLATAESIAKAAVPAQAAEILDLAMQAHGADGLSAPGILADLYPMPGRCGSPTVPTKCTGGWWGGMSWPSIAGRTEQSHLHHAREQHPGPAEDAALRVPESAGRRGSLLVMQQARGRFRAPSFRDREPRDLPHVLDLVQMR
jgi:Acyl-CoA dehydrogenase, C-terminal domain